MSKTAVTTAHPMDEYLRADRLPHIWCPGCGLGITLQGFMRGVFKAGIDLDKVVMVSGIGCTGRAAGYVKLDSFHTTHGRAIPFATGMKLANPALKVVVFSGDGDMVAIGGNHFIHAARRNIDITVVCVNNFNYGMTGGQMGPTTPQDARSTTSRLGKIEEPFNIPHLAAASGATYVARWTVAHVQRLDRAIAEAITKPGFSLVEVISPCPTYFGRMNRLGSGLSMMQHFREHSVVKQGMDPAQVGTGYGDEIIVGKFVDIERPTFPGIGE